MTTTSRSIRHARSIPVMGLVRLTVLHLAITTSVLAQQTPPEQTDAEFVQPFVSDTTFLIVKVDTAQIGLPELADVLKTTAPDAEAAYRQTFQQMSASIEQLRSLAQGQTVFATMGIPISKTRIPFFVFTKKPSPQAAAKMLEVLKEELKVNAGMHGDYVVATHSQDASVTESLAAFPATEREGAHDAFQAVAGYPGQLLLLPPPHVRRTVRELSPELPPQLGGGPSSVLTDGLQWAALGFHPAELRAQFVVQSESEAAARDLAAHLPKMLRSAYESTPQIHERIPPELVQILLGWPEPQVEGRQVVVRLDGLDKTGANLELLAAVSQAIVDKTRRHGNRERFRQILVAMHNYHDTNRSFPPVDKYRGEDGKHRLSWRVHILPYIGQRELYDEFHLDEPWDSPYNKKLFKEMPDVYRTYSLGIPAKAPIKPGYTAFLAPVGKDTVFGGSEATKFQDITDGTVNTIVLVEVKPEEAVPWTAPEDYAFDPKAPSAGLWIGGDGSWLCASADGFVHQLRGDISAEMLLRLFRKSDGEVVDYREIR